MQANNGWLVAIMIAVGVVMIASQFYTANNIIANMPEMPSINIPTADEIASKINVPSVNIDTQQQDEIWEATHKWQIKHFKDDAFDVCSVEFDLDDVEDLFPKYSDVAFVYEYEEDRDFDVINLGLDDEDDRHAIYSGVIKVRVDDDYTDIVNVRCEVTSDDGELEADLTYTL